jgi:hypothetical protein
MNKKTIKAVIDRIEGNKVVMEAEGTYEVIFPSALLPKGFKAGNILNMNISINTADEDTQRKKIKKLQDKLKLH